MISLGQVLDSYAYMNWSMAAVHQAFFVNKIAKTQLQKYPKTQECEDSSMQNVKYFLLNKSYSTPL